ncbi:low temperature requirement protein LtrA [Acinetobacter sp. COS3]|uniref:low temperature requirement protein A n=1 Tax=Acinetobacter TaxID=469 RepID=UPI0003B901A5|nr:MULTISPECIES: low temperature requirement protein A [Acinetobacter]ERS03257.1 low temperature requirement protein LtrA [Acinetobacter sp. COS3]MCR4532283.1 low temperature requirement protein A [Acinetobacter venetianus]MDA0697702.1 low temperature requirement protein A [Pseudomonadota bacterium]MDA1254053.1 low temperature requirement protein A [Pseudomonadota bacterium]
MSVEKILNKPLKLFAPRDPEEAHRAATPLELLFDLIFVVAIATAGQQLHHAMIEGHLWHALPTYCMVFFALWWAWMNFTWFASAYDNDDTLYRCLTFVQIAGSLVMAAGIPAVFQQHNFDVIIIGYVIMRLALVTQWIRVAKHDPERKVTAYRYAIGIVLVQLGWLIGNFSSIHMTTWLFLILVFFELAVPFYAEKHAATPWHPHHIVERYGLLTIIVLGESIIGSFAATQEAFSNRVINYQEVFLIIGGLLMMFAMWWVYFDRSHHHHQRRGVQPFLWGYGHFFIFISIAVLGAALAAAVDVSTQHAHISSQMMGLIIATSLAVYSTYIWLFYEAFYLSGWRRWVYPITVLILFSIPFLFADIGYIVFAMAVIYILRLMISKVYLMNCDDELSITTH